jgi:hypothetical protein
VVDNESEVLNKIVTFNLIDEVGEGIPDGIKENPDGKACIRHLNNTSS